MNMKSTHILQRLIAGLDRLVMPDTGNLTLSPVCVQVEASVSAGQMDAGEARAIMGEVDAKASAMLAVLAILLAASAFLFSIAQSWLSLALMFAQVVTISLSIIYLLRCLVYEPSPALRSMFEMEEVVTAHHLEVEAIKQVRYYNRAIAQTVLTCGLFFIMAGLVGLDAMRAQAGA